MDKKLVSIIFNCGGVQATCYIHSLYYLLTNNYKIDKVIGISGGCITSLASVIYDDIDSIKESEERVKEVHKNYTLLYSGYNFTRFLTDMCNAIFSSEDDWKKCNGRLTIVVRKRRGCVYRTHFISHFNSNKDIIEAIGCSMHIPFLFNLSFSYKGCIDGGIRLDDSIFSEHYLNIKFSKTKNYTLLHVIFEGDNKINKTNKKEIIKLTRNELKRISNLSN